MDSMDRVDSSSMGCVDMDRVDSSSMGCVDMDRVDSVEHSFQFR